MDSRSVRTVLAVLLVLSGCGGAGDEDLDRSAAGTADGEARGSEHLVFIRMTDDMRFEPAHPAVAVGDTVVWINDGAMPHTSTDEPGRAAVPENNVLPDGASTWDSGLLQSGERFQLVMEAPGQYTYLCILHEGLMMIGHLEVVDSDAGPR